MPKPHCRVFASLLLRSSNPDFCPAISMIRVRF